MITVERHADLPRDLLGQAVALTAEVFPGVPELEGLYYYDSVPDWTVAAMDGDLLVGLRPVVARELDLGGERVLMAGGIIPTVRPSHRGLGYARRMVERTLEWFEADGVELSLAFVFDGAPWSFLTPFGYRRVDARFVYEDARGARVDETQPAYARGEPWVDRMEASGEVFVGRGAF